MASIPGMLNPHDLPAEDGGGGGMGAGDAQ